MTRSSCLAFVFTLALAPFAGIVAPARAQSAPGHPELDPILVDNNPVSATSFLQDDDTQNDLRQSDPALYTTVFTRATELKDLADLIRGLPEAYSYRQGLAIRTGCAFCQSPAKFLAWADQYLISGDAPRRAALRQAVFEWDTLNPELRDWLSAHGQSAGAWAAGDLPSRRSAIDPWLSAEYDRLMKQTPLDSGDVDAYRRRAAQISTLLDGDKSARLWERVESAESSVNGLARAQTALAGVSNPQLQALLAQAQNTGSLETRLSLLSRIFDGLGTPDDSVRSSAPPRSGQVFTDASRKATADLLKTSLLQEIKGTWAGDELNAFYATTPLDLRIGVPEEKNTIGSYEPGGPTTFNEEYIQKYLKVKGKDIRDLATDPALLKNLTIDLSALFVHESTHHEQYVWAQQKHLDSLSQTSIELEANETEALFITEKGLRDPSFLAQLQTDAKTPGLASEALEKAHDLTTKGPDAFRDGIAGDNYADELSLEGHMWKSTQWKKDDIKTVQAEIDRRAALPPAQAAALDSGPAWPKQINSDDDWKKAISTSGTQALRDLIAKKTGELGRLPDDYAAYRDHLTKVNAVTDQRLDALQHEADPTKTNRSTVVPPPPSSP